MVRFGDHFPSLSPEVVVAIEQARPQPVPLFKRGERVVVQEGPFTGIEAVYIEPDGEARVMILLRMLGSEQPVSLPLNVLSLAR
jgi:transcriptional antiterminator RfaH